MPVNYKRKDHYEIQDLIDIMRILPAPDGCPWHREQTHQSIRSNLLEETHEAIEAINRNDMKLLCEELGDILLQIVFHAQIEQENNRFDFHDVVDGICKKLIVRHPHVFADVDVENSGQVLENWDKIKRETKGGTSQTELLRSVPKSLPALMRAAKVQGRAARIGFDWPEASGALSALESERRELEEAIADGDAQKMEEELGDLLFSAVNVSRFIDCDAEQSLTSACDKFIKRFELVESLAADKGINLADLDILELDKLWEKAKSING